MRILHVIPSVAPSDGGPSRAIVTIERALAASGVSVVTATTDHGLNEAHSTTEDFEFAGGSVKRVYARKRIAFYKVAPGLMLWLWANVRNFDVVHIHALFSFSSIAAGLIARARGIPYILRPLGTLTGYGMTRRAKLKRASFSLIEAPILRRAAAVHFTSKEEENEAVALDVKLRSVVVPLGVEGTRPGDGNRIEAEHPSLCGKRALLYLSRIDPKKNIEALLEAYAATHEARQNSMLLIAGSGEANYAESLKSRAEALGIADRLIWLGHVDGQKKQDVFARADIFVLPSFSENFGIAAVEAMLAGLPCILGEGVAVANAAAAEGAALSVAPDANAMASALDRLLSDENMRLCMGTKARAHAQKHYSTQAMAKALIELYENVLKSDSTEAA